MAIWTMPVKPRRIGENMNTCVSDDQVVINIQGIRNVSWGQTNNMSFSSNPGKPWYVTVTYKNNHNIFYYRTEVEARSLFEKIRIYMDKTYAVTP